jgi:hypothetical protein
MMCQYIIGGPKTLGFCHNLIEEALIIILKSQILNGPKS